MLRKSFISSVLITGTVIAASLGCVDRGWTQDKPLPRPEPIEPQPTQPQTETAPYYEPKFHLIPENPTVTNEVSLIVEGYLPDTAHKITGGSVDWKEEFIVLHLRVESDGSPGAEVLTPARYKFDLGQLAAGDYVTPLVVNGIEVAYYKFSVNGGIVPNPNPEPEPRPIPRPIPFDSRVIVEPTEPEPNEPFMLYLAGMFPTPGYIFTKKQVLMQDSYYILITVETEAPEGPVLAVTVPFHEPLDTRTLPAGMYKIAAMVDGISLEARLLNVGRLIDDGDIKTSDEEENILLDFRREGGFAGSVAWAHLFENKRYNRFNSLRSNDEIEGGVVEDAIWNELFRCLVEVNFTELKSEYPTPDGWADFFVYTITFRGHTVTIGDGAEIPEPLAKAIRLLSHIVDATTPVVLGYHMRGGFAGVESWVDILDDLEYRRYNAFKADAGIERGAVDASTYERVTDLLNQANFNELPRETYPEAPYADGYLHIIRYNGHQVAIGDGAEISDPLQEAITLLKDILTNTPAAMRESDFATTTAVKNWSAY